MTSFASLQRPTLNFLVNVAKRNAGKPRDHFRSEGLSGGQIRGVNVLDVGQCSRAPSFTAALKALRMQPQT
jgi:hypothetical protein